MHSSETLLALKSCYITSARAGAAFRLHIYIEPALVFRRARQGFCNALHSCSATLLHESMTSTLCLIIAAHPGSLSGVKKNT